MFHDLKVGFASGPQEAGGSLLDPEDCLLVIIDMQDKLLAVMSDRDKTLENNVKLARFAGIVGMPVLVSEQEKLGPTSQVLSEAIPGFSPVFKLDFDACRVGGFRDAVDASGKGTMVVTGIESHICVTQTVLSLLPKHPVHVVADAVASRDPANREVALDRMRQAGAVVTSTEMFMYEALRRAGTPEFKEVLKLVK
jgi:isochorismate hydrolase